MALLRLDKLLAQGAGVSRTDAKRLLAQGAVLVDGKPARQGSQKVETDTQTVLLQGRPVHYSAHVYLLLHKPLGVVSSTDGKDGKTVLDIIAPEYVQRGVFPAGRLDKYSEGMLLLTDDGDFAHRILAPKKHLPKVYECTLDAPILNTALQALFAKGVYLGGGEYSSPAQLEIFSPTEGRVTIYEGIYHQVRRMFDQNGGKVTRLKRVRIGGLPLDPALAPGESRPLTEQELEQLFAPWEGEVAE